MADDKNYQIRHDRPNCIGCAACASIAPDYWVMGEDGKSDVLDSTKTPEGWEEKDIPDSSFEDNKRAAESCPVNVIHIVDKKTGKQLI